jgi:membrane-associated phospholipid phosphatase
VQVQRGRLLLGSSGRAPAVAVLAGCVIVVVVLGLLFKGQTRADGFDSAVDSPFISFFAGHGKLLGWLAFPGTLAPAIVISVVTAAWCLLAGRLNGVVLALTAVPAATGLDDGLLKHVFNRTYLGSLAFPSGHTTSVVALTATLAVLLLVPPPRRASTRAASAALLVVCCAIVAVVVVAVMALRWHYFTDTVAGAAVGLGTVCALALILDLAWPRVGVRSEARSAVASAAGHSHGHVP